MQEINNEVFTSHRKKSPVQKMFCVTHFLSPRGKMY